MQTDLAPQPYRLAWCWFALAFAVYALTRIYAIEDFPIYFFCDEAVQATHARTLLERGLRDPHGQLLPAYFRNGEFWNLSLSVWVQVLPVYLLGTEVWVTRGVSVFFALLAALPIALILRDIFQLRYWWISVLLLAATPTWLLHSRTAFETVLMVSMYPWFLYFYLLYRFRNPCFLFGSVVFGAAAFYAYANGQAVILISALLLAVSDWRYHLRQKRILLLAALLALFLALPFLRFRLEHPDAISNHLRVLNSYWHRDLPLAQKLERFISNYFYGLSPQYWFIPNEQDLVRHRFKGWGHMAAWELPLLLVGAGMLLARARRDPASRALIAAALAAPFGAALAEIYVTRVLLAVVPFTMAAAIGLNLLLVSLPKVRWREALAVLVSAGLSLFSLFLMRSALRDGPVWFSDYGIGGMQWDSKRVFQELKDYRAAYPDHSIWLSPDWANGLNVLSDYFMPGDSKLETRDILDWIKQRHPLGPEHIFLLSFEQFSIAEHSGFFEPIKPEKVIPYPDGRPGFYLTRLQYRPGIDEVFSALQAERRKLQTSQYRLGHEEIKISYSKIDTGQIGDIFDGDPFTLMRGEEVNPFIVDVEFPSPRPVDSLLMHFASMDFKLTISAFDSEGQNTDYVQEFRRQPQDPQVELPLSRGPAQIKRLRIEIEDLQAQEPVHIHLRELRFK